MYVKQGQGKTNFKDQRNINVHSNFKLFKRGILKKMANDKVKATIFLEQALRGLIKVPKSVKSLHLHVITSIYAFFRQG